MDRSIYLRGPCSCSMPGLSKLLEREKFEKAAARRGAKVTAVGRYVESKHRATKRKLAHVLTAAAGKIRLQVERAYKAHAPKPLEKGTRADKARIVQSILDRLNTDGIGVDLSSSIEPAMLAAFRRAAAVGVTQAGFGMDRSIVNQLDARAKAFAEQRAGELVTDLADTTLEDLRRLITRGVEEGMSTDALGDEIEEMGAFSDSRAEMIARTELANAHVQGNVDGWRVTGEVEGKESILGDLHDIVDVCDECEDAGVVGLDEDFVDGYDFPPYHPNCICDIKPVLSADD